MDNTGAAEFAVPLSVIGVLAEKPVTALLVSATTSLESSPTVFGAKYALNVKTSLALSNKGMAGRLSIRKFGLPTTLSAVKVV